MLGEVTIMTTEELKLANELNGKINKLKSFLHYYKDKEYEISINLKNTRESSFHTETFYFKEDDKILLETIHEQLSKKLSKMQKILEEL